MEHMFKRILALTTLLTCIGMSDNVSAMAATAAANVFPGPVTPKFTIRSQGTNALRRLVQTWDMMNLYDTDKMNGFFSVMPEYTRSFNDRKIAECLFGTNRCNNNGNNNCDDGTSFLVQGIDVEGRSSNALLASNFFLPSDYSSVVTVKPVIQSFLVDFFGYVGLDSCYEGLYAWIQFPVTWTKWDLRLCERIVAPGENAIPAGIISPGEVARDNLQTSFQTYLRGAQLAPIVSGDTTVNIDALTCAKVCGHESKTAVSEVRFCVGYNFLLCEDYHFGVGLEASAPTGNKVKSAFLFAPQNGNDRHWELGVNIDAHAILWRCEEEESHFGFYVDANITHMFKHHQERCFDLCGKPLSRYMAAARVATPNTPADDLLFGTNDAGVQTAASAVFSGEFAPVANITTFNVDVSVSVNADVVAMFNYTCGNWSWDLGYNFWGRSCEKLKLNCECPTTLFAENTWVLNGDASQFGCEAGGEANALSASQNSATITTGQNFTTNPPFTVAQTEAGLGNNGVDNAQLASFGEPGGTFAALEACSNDDVAINTSIQPIFIKQTDINFAKTQGISNKIFSHIGYNWECECWNPFFGIGFEAEFAQHNKNDNCNNNECETSCNNDCDDGLQGNCVRCGLSQWGIWVKGGVAFN
jgi:hypothetical protein